MSYLDLTGGDQIVDVIESFLHCCTYRHQPVVPQDQHLRQEENKQPTTVSFLLRVSEVLQFKWSSLNLSSYLALRPDVLLYDGPFFIIHQYAMVIVIGHLAQRQCLR